MKNYLFMLKHISEIMGNYELLIEFLKIDLNKIEKIINDEKINKELRIKLINIYDSLTELIKLNFDDNFDPLIYSQNVSSPTNQYLYQKFLNEILIH